MSVTPLAKIKRPLASKGGVPLSMRKLSKTTAHADTDEHNAELTHSAKVLPETVQDDQDASLLVSPQSTEHLPTAAASETASGVSMGWVAGGLGLLGTGVAVGLSENGGSSSSATMSDAATQGKQAEVVSQPSKDVLIPTPDRAFTLVAVADSMTTENPLDPRADGADVYGQALTQHVQGHIEGGLKSGETIKIYRNEELVGEINADNLNYDAQTGSWFFSTGWDGNHPPTDYQAILTQQDGNTVSASLFVAGEKPVSSSHAVIAGVVSDFVVEEGAQPIAWMHAPNYLTITDADAGKNHFQSGAFAGKFGSVQLSEDGMWFYTLDNSNLTVDALNQGDTLTDVVTVYSADGTAQDLTITINGSDDAVAQPIHNLNAQISGAISATVSSSQQWAESWNDIHQLTIADPDEGQAKFQDRWYLGTYGNVSLNEDGSWTYHVDNPSFRGDSSVALLKDGETLVDTVTVYSEDASSQVLTIIIEGNTPDAQISGAISATVSSSQQWAESWNDIHQLTIADPDEGQAKFQDRWYLGTYGNVSLNEDGSWTYHVDNPSFRGDSSVALLKDGETLVDTVTVYSEDASSQVLTIAIEGNTPDAQISGAISATVSSSQQWAESWNDTHQLTIADPDEAQAKFQHGWYLGTYGKVSLNGDGSWTYHVDDPLHGGGASVASLKNGETLVDTVTIYSADGTAQDLMITIVNPEDDMKPSEAIHNAIIGGGTTTVVFEQGTTQLMPMLYATPEPALLMAAPLSADAYEPVTPSDLTVTDVQYNVAQECNVMTPSFPIYLCGSGQLTITDNDVGEAHFHEGVYKGDFGAVQLNEDGLWFYTLDDANPTVDALNNGDSLTDTVTVYSADGTAQDLTITINGSDDVVVNHAPVANIIADSSIVVEPNQPYALNVSHFPFFDMDGHALLAVIFDKLPQLGMLSLDGVAVSAGQSISVEDIQAQRLTYTPPEGFIHDWSLPSWGDDSIVYRVQDDGGIVGAGADTSLDSGVFNVFIGSITTEADPLPPEWGGGSWIGGTPWFDEAMGQYVYPDLIVTSDGKEDTGDLRLPQSYTDEAGNVIDLAAWVDVIDNPMVIMPPVCECSADIAQDVLIMPPILG